MRPATRKALTALLIAVTLGVAYALVSRSRRAPAEPAAVPDEAPRPVEPEPVRPEPVLPVREFRAAPAAPAEPARRPEAEPSAVRAADRKARPTPSRASLPVEPPRPVPDIVEIDPDRLPPVAPVANPVPVSEVPPAADAKPARGGRRSQFVVGGVALAFVVTAAAIGTMVYGSVSDKDNAKSAASSAPTGRGASPSASPSATFAPLPPQKFESAGTRSGGALNRLTLSGRRSGVTADVWVWLPPQYQQKEFAGKTFPVLVVHSSYPGVDANSMLDQKSGLLAKLTEGVSNGSLPPFIVVAPELTPYTQAELDQAADPATLDTECSDIPGKPRMATFHNEDVREAVAATYRVAPDRTAWALLGEGAGGLCAAKYALQYPQYYAAAASLSGRTTLRSPLWPTPAARSAQDLAQLLAAKPDVRVLLSNTTGDTTGRQASTALKDVAKAPTVVEASSVTGTASGTGSGDTAKQLPAALTFLDRYIVDPTAAGTPATGGTRRSSGR
ncbi:alpha/beta hydrolase-fold protein [Yinghuangia seranimata]|uniref:alpha/beta hydrolase-fold protein n=1 Tax=Yinghuangia seranimata TaxID=408067 RepID=UPI00248ACC0A|nr:alpha/beta hydrolase-fold protein [Yinghuangia seranimata]MDI2127938.1 alpha/beta hydrolase-fold protein [Yinghuangia seranimata]